MTAVHSFLHCSLYTTGMSHLKIMVTETASLGRFLWKQTYLFHNWTTYWSLSLLLHRAFWRFTEYYTPTNAL